MIGPRYLPKISEDLTVLDLVEPASEADHEMAMARHLPQLARRRWILTADQRDLLRAFCNENGESSFRSGKETLLRMALPRVREQMKEKQTVRLGRIWLTQGNGRRRILRPSRELGYINEPNGDRFCLVPWPQADKVDAFARYLEQCLIGDAIRELSSE